MLTLLCSLIFADMCLASQSTPELRVGAPLRVASRNWGNCYLTGWLAFSMAPYSDMLVCSCVLTVGAFAGAFAARRIRLRRIRRWSMTRVVFIVGDSTEALLSVFAWLWRDLFLTTLLLLVGCSPAVACTVALASHLVLHGPLAGLFQQVPYLLIVVYSPIDLWICLSQLGASIYRLVDLSLSARKAAFCRRYVPHLENSRNQIFALQYSWIQVFFSSSLTVYEG